MESIKRRCVDKITGPLQLRCINSIWVNISRRSDVSRSSRAFVFVVGESDWCFEKGIASSRGKRAGGRYSAPCDVCRRSTTVLDRVSNVLIKSKYVRIVEGRCILKVSNMFRRPFPWHMDCLGFMCRSWTKRNRHINRILSWHRISIRLFVHRYRFHVDFSVLVRYPSLF